jgi:hypothetical protein
MQQGILAAGPVFDVREEQVVNQSGSDHPRDCSKMGQCRSQNQSERPFAAITPVVPKWDGVQVRKGLPDKGFWGCTKAVSQNGTLALRKTFRPESVKPYRRLITRLASYLA